MTRKLNLATPAERAQHRQRLAERKAREQREQDVIVRRVQEGSPEITRQEFDVLVIPAGLSPSSALPAERIKEYTEHLRKIISEADDLADAVTARTHQKMRERAERGEALFAAEPTLRAVSNRLCGMCRGGCCTAGGNAAFITSATIRRVREQMPELSDEDILQAYLSRLSTQTITDACINQTTTGCVLPTEMRSDTCNGFFCDALSDWHERPRQERADTVLAIQRGEPLGEHNNLDLPNHIIDVALVKPDALLKQCVDLEP